MSGLLTKGYRTGRADEKSTAVLVGGVVLRSKISQRFEEMRTEIAGG
jgi:hypothetical protein